MSDPATTEAHPEVEHEGHAHPTDLGYVKIALFLAFLTGAEVSTYSFGLHGPAIIVMLLALMVVKFGCVAAFFMHLRFDSRWFRRFFITGILLAVCVYMIVLTTLHRFQSA